MAEARPTEPVEPDGNTWWNKEGVQNWMKWKAALHVFQDGLLTFVPQGIKQCHRDMMNCLMSVPNSSRCNECTTGLLEVKYAKENQNGDNVCRRGICDKIIVYLRDSHMSGSPSFENANPLLWCSEPWQIAKCFMPRSGRFYEDIGSPEDTDANGVFNVVLHCRYFQKVFQQDLWCNDGLAYRVKRLLNEVRHETRPHITNDELSKTIVMFRDVLTDPNLHGCALKEVDKLEKLLPDKHLYIPHPTMSKMESASKLSNYNTYLSSREHFNWTKCIAAFQIVKEVLDVFVMTEMEKMRKQILSKVRKQEVIKPSTECEGCSIEDILACPTQLFCQLKNNICKKHANKPHISTVCAKKVCNGLQKEIKENFRSDPKYGPQWALTDSKKWCKSAWHIAKCYLPNLRPFRDIKDIQDATVLEIVTIMLNCKVFEKAMGRHVDFSATNNPVAQVRYRHRQICFANPCMTDEESVDCFRELGRLLKALLQKYEDTNEKESAKRVTDATVKLLELKKEEFNSFVQERDKVRSLESKVKKLNEQVNKLNVEVNDLKDTQEEQSNLLLKVQDRLSTLEQSSKRDTKRNQRKK